MRDSQAELTMRVIAPASDATGHHQRAGMRATRRDCRNTVEYIGRWWGRAIIYSSVAELAEGIPTPASYPAVRCQHAGMGAAGGDRRDLAKYLA